MKSYKLNILKYDYQLYETLKIRHNKKARTLLSGLRIL